MSVRIATPADSDAVTGLLQASYPTLMRGAYDDDLLEAVLPAMTKAQPGLLASGTYYVATLEDGSLAGCGGWTRERPDDGDISKAAGHIRHFAVHPDRARQGVGRAIYERCRADARAAGLDRLECYSSLNGESFYSALGFKRLRIIQVPMHNDIAFPSVHMVAAI